MNKISKVLSFLSLSILVLTATLGSLQIHAAGQVTMKPGDIGEFTINYGNTGDEELMENVVRKIYVGNELELDVNSITDQFDNGPVYRLSPSLVSDDTVWGKIISYRPLSATNPSSPSGVGTPGNVIMIPTKVGKIVFKAKLKNDVLTRRSVGDVLQPINKQGIYSVSEESGVAKAPDGVNIKIAAPVVTSSSMSSLSSESSSLPPVPVDTELPRTGGFTTAIGIALAAGIIGFVTYVKTRRRRLKVE